MSKIEYDQHIAIYEKVISDEICDQLVTWYKQLKDERITLSAKQDANLLATWRTDKVIQIPAGCPSWCFPTGITKSMWPIVENCMKIYCNKYEPTPPQYPLISDGWKMLVKFFPSCLRSFVFQIPNFQIHCSVVTSSAVRYIDTVDRHKYIL